MFLPLILILVSTVTSLFEGIAIKKYNTKYKKGGFFFTALVSLFSMLFFIITDKNGLCFSKEVLFYGAISAVMFCSASLFTYYALQCGSFAMTMLVLSYSIILSIIYGVRFLHESTSVWRYIGFALLMISIYFMNGNEKKHKKKMSFKWITAVLISFLGSGGFCIIQRMQQIRFDDAYTNEFMIITLGLSGAVLLIIGIAADRGDIMYVLKNGGIYAAGAGISNGASNFMGLIVNTMIPFSIASPMRAGIKIIVSFLVSVILFKEKFKTSQIIGLTIGTLALIFLNL